MTKVGGTELLFQDPEGFERMKALIMKLVVSSLLVFPGIALAELGPDEAELLRKGLESRYFSKAYGMWALLGSVPIPKESEAYRLGVIQDNGSIKVITIVVERIGTVVFRDEIKRNDGPVIRRVVRLSGESKRRKLGDMPSIEQLAKVIEREGFDIHVISTWFCCYQRKPPGLGEWQSVGCPIGLNPNAEFRQVFALFDSFARESVR